MSSDCLQRALMLLTRREHSARELEQKLIAKGFQSEQVHDAIKECQALGYQSDERFAELYVRSRKQKGYGVLKIKLELGARGIDSDLINEVFKQNQDWVEHALKALQKKFRGQLSTDVADLAKQKRYLQSRGFSNDVIKQTISEINSEL